MDKVKNISWWVPGYNTCSSQLLQTTLSVIVSVLFDTVGLAVLLTYSLVSGIRDLHLSVEKYQRGLDVHVCCKEIKD